MKNTETASQWVLIDMMNPDQFSVLSIGSTNFSGASMRKNLDSLGRELLLDRTRRAMVSAVAVRETAEVRGAEYDVLVDPILSPTSRTVVGALAIYVPSGHEFPERPVVGSIEWEIRDGGRRITTVWNDDMFILYGIRRSGMGSAGDFTQWVNELIAPEDRARMKVVITGGIAAPDEQRHLVAYRILTGDGQSRYLEASGRVYLDRESGAKWLRSITREVPGSAPKVTPNNVDTSSGPLLRAAFELSDNAMFAMDISWSQIFMTSPSWENVGLQYPSQGHLPHVIHPDDLQVFNDIFDELGGKPSGGIPVRFLHTSGSYQTYKVCVSNGHSHKESGHRYAVVSLRAAPTEGS